jgi:hydrophobic/amphiphilic exporter-1 (mainly G- bacteria), HAE1 family
VDGVPLRELVRVREAAGPSEIRRMDQSRVVTVTPTWPGRRGPRGGAVGASLAAAPPPRGLRVEIGGENEEMRAASASWRSPSLLALLLVYMILAAEFESLLFPFMVMLAVPLAAVGAAVALWVTGAGINTMSSSAW